MADKDIDKDDTEDKAKAIGEKVGIDKTDEEAPDYEITEDKGETVVDTDTKKDDKKDADEEEGDERLGKRRDEVEKKHLTNREKRHIRKERLRKKIDAKDQLILQQQEQINNLGGQIAHVNGRLANYDVAQVQTALNEANNYFNVAQQAYDTAFNAGDGIKCREAMERMYDSKRRADEMQAILSRLGNQPQMQPQVSPSDTIIRDKANSWASRNTWFKPGGADDDSAIADAIAAKMRKEGFKFTSDEDWDELDERLAVKGIGDTQEEDDEQDEPVSKRTEQTQRRKSPPVGGGGSGRGDLANGKVQVSLPTAYIENLKQAGMWDDPKIRSKMIKKYLDGIKNREAS